VKAHSSARTVGIEFLEPEGLEAHFADRMTVSIGEETVIVRFYQVDSPLVRSDEDAASVTSVKANCLAKVMLTPLRTKELIKQLTGALDAFAKRIKEPEVG
jgi:hypothetical protein